MGALFGRVKVWVSAEDVVYSDLNAEFDNILTNLVPLMVDDYSTNVSQMQTTVDPGEVGTESLATSLAGEIARLRHLIKEITGETQWYSSPDASISTLASLLGTGLQDNRISSGRVRSNSQQPIFLQPLGTNRTVTLVAANTSFVYYVDGTQYTISSNVTLTSLTAAPTSNNTALINSSTAADQDFTKYVGEDGTVIPIDTAGTEITALVGKFAAFRLNNGSADEYLTAYVESSTALTKARRGFFFDSTDTPVQRIVYSDNDTLHLLKLTWIFAKTDGTLTASYTTPIWSKDEPSSPSTNDYWFDLANATWKKYDISSFIAANATLIGSCAQNTTATIGARSFEFFQAWEESNTVELVKDSATQAKSRWPGSTVSVWGTALKYEHNLITWDMTLDLDTGVTEAASTNYFFYITENGDKVISDVRPYDRREDLRGYYHPHQSWRCVGKSFNDASQNLTPADSYFRREEAVKFNNAITGTNVSIEVVSRVNPINSSTGALSVYVPPAAYWRGQTHTYIKTSNDFNAVNIVAFSGEYINDAVNTTINSQFESIDLLSDGANVFVTKRVVPSYWINVGAINIFATTTAPTKGSSLVFDRHFVRRLGSDLEIRYEYQQTGNAGAAAGTGHYVFPYYSEATTGIRLDTTVGVNTNTVSSGGQDYVGPIGIAKASHPGTTNGFGFPMAYNTTHARLFVTTVAVNNPVSIGQTAAHYQVSDAAGVTYSAVYKIPVAGWKGI